MSILTNSSQIFASTRVIVFRANLAPSGAVLGPSDILDSPFYRGLKVFENRYNTKFLADETYVVGNVSEIWGHEVKLNIPLNFDIEYSDGATYSTIKKNGIYLLFVSDIGAGGNVPTLRYQSRLLYNDA